MQVCTSRTRRRTKVIIQNCHVFCLWKFFKIVSVLAMCHYKIFGTAYVYLIFVYLFRLSTSDVDGASVSWLPLFIEVKHNSETMEVEIKDYVRVCLLYIYLYIDSIFHHICISLVIITCYQYRPLPSEPNFNNFFPLYYYSWCSQDDEAPPEGTIYKLVSNVCHIKDNSLGSTMVSQILVSKKFHERKAVCKFFSGDILLKDNVCV